MLTSFLLLIIGGFLLGCTAIITAIIFVTMIWGCFEGCAALHKTSCNRLAKVMHKIPKIRRLSSRTIEAQLKM